MMNYSSVPTASAEHDFVCLTKISGLINQIMDPKTVLAQTTDELHAILIFDNLVVYAFDPLTSNLDAAYARALGRGKQAGAEVDWGEKLANQLAAERKMILEKPKSAPANDRLNSPFLLGIPIFSAQVFLGALVLIRYGGPEFDKRDLLLANFFAQQTGILFERQNFIKEKDVLQARQEELRLQEDFLSTITHEINSPLGFIKGYTTTLLRPDTHWDQVTQLEFLKIIDQETDHMQELIGNLLDSARAQSNQLKMTFDKVRLDSLINDVIARAYLKNPELEISAQFPEGLAAIDGDCKRLSQVLDNLVNNAIKYAPGALVRMAVEQDSMISTITFTDQGPGIAEMYLAHLFDRFFRIPDSAGGKHGSGLGLYICKKIIGSHKGKITVTSTVGKGTSFQIILPNQH
jgi:signal transduction histidine kinase